MTDLTGKKFGRLTAIKRTDNDKWGHPRYLCGCDCKNEVIVLGNDLKSGNTKSCNCINIERLTKHGHKKKRKISKTYKSWANMVQRCTNPNNKFYQDYGGRGIKVCKRWRKFTNFLEDMGEAPKGLQIHREDNDGNYCKLNCRWATRKEQMRNTRRNHLITFRGKTQCLAAWAEKSDIKVGTLYTRINRLGWSTEKALTTVVIKKEKKK